MEEEELGSESKGLSMLEAEAVFKLARRRRRMRGGGRSEGRTYDDSLAELSSIVLQSSSSVAEVSVMTAT